MKLNSIHTGDSLQYLKSLPDNSVNCCVTSPPYFNLRDYGADGQIGVENTPDQYVKNLVEIFHEVKRVLIDDGTFWLNIGDTYSNKYNNRGTKNNPLKSKDIIDVLKYKPKDLIGVPWLLAFALRADGWFLRSEIIWNKANVVPEAIKDRCTRSHEFIFMLSKSKKYYYDYEAVLEVAVGQKLVVKDNKNSKYEKGYNGIGRTKKIISQVKDGVVVRNRRDVWTMPTSCFKGAHFAPFPEALPTFCIQAGCPEGGVVLDPFMGAGTTGVAAKKLNRNFIGCDLNPEYVKIATERINSI